MTDIEFLIEQNELRPSKPPRAKISEYAEEKRILPPDTPFPGSWNNSRTPYSIEIMDNMSPHSPIIYQAAMKGAQLGLTAAGENVLAFWMDESPAPIMLISATDDLLDEWSDKRLEPLIDSCEFRHKIKAQTENRKSRKSGDKATSKTFTGGFLLLSSAQSPAKLRSNSIRVLIRDEIDGAPRELRTGEGNWLKVSLARTNAWGPRKKVFDISTPTLFETSAIYQSWELGDRREYKVPCPFCKKKQTLNFNNLVPEFDGSFLINVRYRCEHCSELINNHHKTYMLANGKWKATAKPSHKNYRSYQISSLYSPVGMLSWTELYQEYLNVKDDPDGMRSFTNLYLGLPYKEIGIRPKVEKVIEHRGKYKSGEVPNEVIYITGGADVQRGKKQYENFTDDELEKEMEKLNQKGKNIWTMGFPRIEIEILGHSWGYRTYSIEYKVFYGHTHDPHSGAWDKLRRWFEETKLIYSRIDGSKIECPKILIDSGDGERTATVYTFCEPYMGVWPCKGDQVLKKNKDIKGDEITGKTALRYTKNKLGESQILINVSTNYYKGRVYQGLTIPRVQSEEQRPGFPEFPRDYPDHYFKMLTNEEKHTDGSFHAGGRPVEALDCRVYALCAGDILLDEYVFTIRDALIKKGMNRERAKIEWDHKKQIENLKFRRWEEMKKLAQ
jgi:phage terminase large subunit GpA-like protein